MAITSTDGWVKRLKATWKKNPLLGVFGSLISISALGIYSL